MVLRVDGTEPPTDSRRFAATVIKRRMSMNPIAGFPRVPLECAKVDVDKMGRLVVPKLVSVHAG